MINYNKFWETIKRKNISTYNLINDYGFSKGLIDNLKHNRSITMTTLNDICNKIGCNPNDVIEYVEDEKPKFSFFPNLNNK